MDIQGKRVVISGASSGIGAATGELLAHKGAEVVLLARTKAKLDELANDIRAAGGRAHVVAVDLADGEASLIAGRRILEEIGPPDVVVNNAGAGRWLAVDETDPEEAVRMMGAPYFAAFFLTRALLPTMLSRGTGLIVNVNSPVSRAAWPGATGYAAARWALRGFSAGLRADCRGTGVRVTEFVSGEVSSPYFDNNPGARERIPRIASLFPPLTPQQAAAGIHNAIRSERRLVVKPWVLGPLFWANNVVPWLVRALVERTGWSRR